jgi:hypothetical protein
VGSCHVRKQVDKIKKMKIAVLLALLGLILSSCYCDAPKSKGPIRITPTAKGWISYQSGQDLSFETANGKTTSIKVVQYRDTMESFFSGDECPEGLQEIIEAKLFGLLLKDTIQVEITHQLINLHQKDLYILYFVDEKRVHPKDQPEQYAFLETIDLAGKPYFQVLKTKCSTCDKASITELYWARGLGLVGFVLNQEVWTLK